LDVSSTRAAAAFQRPKKIDGAIYIFSRTASSSAIGIWFLLFPNRYFNHSSNCLGTRRDVDLTAAPIIHHPQKGLRYPHLKRAILSTF